MRDGRLDGGWLRCRTSASTAILLASGLALGALGRTSRPLGAWGRCVFVANDHGQVLEEWLAGAAASNGAAAPLAVLHIDAHGDLNVPQDVALDVFEPEWRQSAAKWEALAGAADLANFQQLAAWAGLVDSVIWVRQGWGASEQYVTTLCFDNTTSSFAEALEGQRCFPGATPGSEREVRQLSVREVPEDSLRESGILEVVREQLHGRPYILDVDLDFFVHGRAAPGRPPWLDSGPDCPPPCLRWAEPDCPLWRALEARMTEERLPSAPRARWPLKHHGEWT